MRINAQNAIATITDTVSSTALTLSDLGFTDEQIKRANTALITRENFGLRYRYDGGVPTGTIGHVLASGERLELFGNANVRNLQVIRSTANDSIVTVTLSE